MQQEIINILICSDALYLVYYSVMLTSLFENNKYCKFNVHLLTDSSWTINCTHQLKKLTKKYQSNFYYYIVDDEVFSKLPTTMHISKSSYYRLYAANLLPEHVDKVLYIDGDVIVKGDVRPIWQLNMDNIAIAGAYDATFNESENYIRLGYNQTYGYINGGVAIYNLAYWRSVGLSRKAMDFIEKNPEKVLWMDQDILNALFYDKKKLFPLRFNYQVTCLTRDHWDKYNSHIQSQIFKESKEIVIIHYSGQTKPWSQKVRYIPLYKFWRKYYFTYLLKCTPCVIPSFIKTTIKTFLKKILRKNKYRQDKCMYVDLNL